MSNADKIPQELRSKDVFHHIDPGFINRRLCTTALPSDIRTIYFNTCQPGNDHFSALNNDHLLVMMILDICDVSEAPTLLQALTLKHPRCLFRSTERLAPCSEIHNEPRVEHDVLLDIDFGKPVRIAYHTNHLVSDTGKMTLARGAKEGYVESIVGVLHDRPDKFEIEPLIIGAPWLDHPRNEPHRSHLMCFGRDFGEILPEDIEQFSKMAQIRVESDREWMDALKAVPEAEIKAAFACLLNEPTKKDWPGELNDHFSGNVILAGKRKTAAFLFKGPAEFREMTLDMCGKRADQIFRLTNSGAEISVVQHCHLIGEAVRTTLRSMTFYPGNPRKYCLIDGQATFRILKAYSLI